MKRSESMLVYGVTAILLVIVGVAVIFGDGPAVQGNETSSNIEDFLKPDPTKPGGGSESTGGFAIDDDQSSAQDPAQDPTENLSTDTGGAPGGPAVDEGGDVIPSDIQPLEVMLADLGPSVVIEAYDSNRFRRVRVEAGMSFEEICSRFAPGYELNDVHILNEGIDPANLEIGSELLLPYVPDEKLIEAYKLSLAGQASGRRGSSGRSSSNGGLVPPASSSSPASGTGGSHLVTEGDSLWAIAKSVVGARRATAYAEEIRIANGLPSNKIIPGKTLVLPAH